MSAPAKFRDEARFILQSVFGQTEEPLFYHTIFNISFVSFNELRQVVVQLECAGYFNRRGRGGFKERKF
jgi:hypothetical protein